MDPTGCGVPPMGMAQPGRGGVRGHGATVEGEWRVKCALPPPPPGTGSPAMSNLPALHTTDNKSKVGCAYHRLAGKLSFCLLMRAPAHVSQSFCAMTLLCRVAIADCCGVVQLSPASSAVVKVMNQLLHYGEFASLCLFHSDILDHFEWQRCGLL